MKFSAGYGENRVIITADLDFPRLLATLRAEEPGVILLRGGNYSEVESCDYIISLSSDPDVRIQEEFEGKLRNILAIEIKGGADVSNARNRAGEAEKSHRKAKRQDFRDYWKIISLAGVDLSMLRQESPATNSWFDVAQAPAPRSLSTLERDGHDHGRSESDTMCFLAADEFLTGRDARSSFVRRLWRWW